MWHENESKETCEAVQNIYTYIYIYIYMYGNDIVSKQFQKNKDMEYQPRGSLILFPSGDRAIYQKALPDQLES